MPQTEIEIHFDQMKGLSEELGDAAKNLKRAADNMGMGIISDTKTAWISVHADTFVGKEVRLVEKIRESAANLNDISMEIYEKAKKIYESEQRNTLTARLRNYL